MTFCKLSHARPATQAASKEPHTLTMLVDINLPVQACGIHTS